MASLRNVLLVLFVLLSNVEFLLANYLQAQTQPTDQPQTYVVHLMRPDGLSDIEDLVPWYHSFLPENISTTSENPSPILYAYERVMTGFAARLTPGELAAIEEKEGFIAAHLEKTYHLHTTHSPQFLGLPQQPGSRRGSNLGKGIIIGILDSGVSPNHPSFRGNGMPPPPAKWKGRCDFKLSECNNKLIGARSFQIAVNSKENAPAMDHNGHGTHTAGTAAGAFVKPADVLGSAGGTAVGMAPKAHLSIYKVCDGTICSAADILAAIDAAIVDGVDVLSLSLGGGSTPFYEDFVAIGAFAAIRNGVFVSTSAGNSGDLPSTLSNEAPWVLTVGASTIDRDFVATVKLGNGVEYDGESLFQPHFPLNLLPLVYPGMITKEGAGFCTQGSLEGVDVKGKVVFCDGVLDQGLAVKNAGGAALILMSQQADEFFIPPECFVLPASQVSYFAGMNIKAYMNSTEDPTATIVFKGTVYGNPTAPAVAIFSSRGPSLASPGILKPDIIGPGVNILAAWPFPIANETKSKFNFNMDSGTSVSCPHVSGIAALVKRAHPHWTPAAIKSAIMTSAGQLNLGKGPILDGRLQPADLFAIGAGHVNPRKAIDPGLVYDIQPDDYIPYLCGLGYTDKQVSMISHKPINCSRVSSIPEAELNYPSFSVALGPPQTFTRTVTNVGEAFSSYVVTVVPPQGVYVNVKPSQLSFSEVLQKATYSVTFRRVNFTHEAGEYTQGYLKWISGKYLVRSPISVKFN